MTQNDSEWPKRPTIAQNGPKGHKGTQMVQNGQNGPKGPKGYLLESLLFFLGRPVHQPQIDIKTF